MESDCDIKQLNILSVGRLTDDRPGLSLAVCGSVLRGQCLTPTASSTSSKSLHDKDSNIIEDL